MSLVGHGGIIIYLKLHTKVTKLHLHMESGGQIDGQMSSQSPVVWWYLGVNCEVVGMCVEVIAVLGAESVGFLFN
jgi:hypothetical protein